MHDIVAALDRERPTLVAQQIGREEDQAIAGIDLAADHRPDFDFPTEIADGRADAKTLAKQRGDHPASEIAGAPRYKDRATPINSIVHESPSVRDRSVEFT